MVLSNTGEMADPVIPNVVRAQSIWHGPSGLPTDRFVTTWAFVRDQAVTGDAGTQADEVAERLREFWLEPTDASPNVAFYIPGSIVDLGLEIRCYDLGEAVTPPQERTPRIYEYEAIGMGGNNSTPLPREVAVTLSFYAERNQPRLRGRVYLGPFTSSALTVEPDDARVSTSMRTAIVKAAHRLSSAGMGVGDRMQWGVLSQMDQEIRPVTHGWVDDAFDTIRSRGQDPLTRTTFSPAGPA